MTNHRGFGYPLCQGCSCACLTAESYREDAMRAEKHCEAPGPIAGPWRCQLPYVTPPSSRLSGDAPEKPSPRWRRYPRCLLMVLLLGSAPSAVRAQVGAAGVGEPGVEACGVPAVKTALDQLPAYPSPTQT